MEPLESLQVEPKPLVSGYQAFGNNDQGTKVQKNMQSKHRNRGKGVRKGLFWWDFSLVIQNPTEICIHFVSEWMEWGAWSTCSTSVGRGNRTRERDCVFLPHSQVVTSSTCHGKRKESGLCGGKGRVKKSQSQKLSAFSSRNFWVNLVYGGPWVEGGHPLNGKFLNPSQGDKRFDLQ